MDSVSTNPDWFVTVQKCLMIENSVELCDEGVGGTYFIRDSEDQYMAIFKPVDEEPGAVLNPKKRLQNPLLLPGGGAIRERAAFLLDTNHAARVPETLLVDNFKHEHFNNHDKVLLRKNGSLQKYIKNIGHSDTMGSSNFPVTDIHHIGILDIRLLNLDRNGENILVVKDPQTGYLTLIPIDHSYTLPENLNDQFYFEWLYWRQAKLPFNASTLQLIESIDIDADSMILGHLGIDQKAIQLMRFSSILLKKGAKAGLTLYQIACWLTTPRPRNEVSQLRGLVDKSNQLSKFNPLHVERIFEQLVDELISS